MEYNAQIRKAIKAEQKANVMANLGRCFGATALMILPVFLIGLLGAGIMTLTVLSQANAFALYDPYTASQHLSNSMMNGYVIIILLEIAVAGPLTLGLMNFYIAIQRGERPGIGLLFHPFASIRTIWRSIRMLCCTMFRTLLWLIGPYVVFVVLAVVLMVPMAVGMAYGNEPGTGFLVALIVLFVLYFIAIMLFAVRAAAYLPGYVLMHDDGEVGAWQATKRAGAVFKGRYKDMLTFFLSFLPWYLLFYGVVIVVAAIMAFASMSSMPNDTAQVATFAVTYAVTIVLSIFFGGFLGAYQTTSFFAMYEYLAPQPGQPAELAQPEAAQPAIQPGQDMPDGAQPEEPDAPGEGAAPDGGGQRPDDE